MTLLLFLVLSARVPAAHQSAAEPFLPISVWYPATADVEALRRDFSIIRKAGFNAVTTTIVWRDGEPHRGAYNLLNLDRVIAVAAQAGLKVQVEVDTRTPPPWNTDAASPRAAEFHEYVRRRVAARREVVAVSRTGGAGDAESDRAMVGRGAGSLTPRQARKAFWTALAKGARSFGLRDPDDPVGPNILALGETVGVVTRNPALFARLQRRTLRDGELTVSGGGEISVEILESPEAIVIIAINTAPEVRKVTVTFPSDIPEAIWQNMEEGMAVYFVASRQGPLLEHIFAPEDVLVLAIRKTLR